MTEPPHVSTARRVIVDVAYTSRRLLDLEPDTEYVISLAARTVAGRGPVLTAEDRTLKMSGKAGFTSNHRGSTGSQSATPSNSPLLPSMHCVG